MFLIKYVILCHECNNYFNHSYFKYTKYILNRLSLSNYYLFRAIILNLVTVQVKIMVILGFIVFFRRKVGSRK